ncbi:MAG: PhoH family protein [Deltaproteobacteria bacterium]|jgi:phosphate starvation-inducible PhoH-like protein|nr:PhoH family protein [Deltaproteobacteria bacterium]
MTFDDPRLANALFGPQGRNLRRLEELSGLRIRTRGTTLGLEGEAGTEARVENLLRQFYGLLQAGTRLEAEDFEQAYALLLQDAGQDLGQIFKEALFVPAFRRGLAPKNLRQRAYIAALRSFPLVFGVGPAGTGKTYLAVAAALSMLLARKVRRIVLTRPAVEAGENLGFLPGDLAEKVDPYLRPLYDALGDLLDADRVSDMFGSGLLEIAPLAFMRGRTLNDSFIILDEAQNTTRAQMKMFLTRMGEGSRIAVTGDITQIDLPARDGEVCSGLVHALRLLRKVEGIKTVFFSKEDVVRHPLVARIVEAYDSEKDAS